jgi:peptidoglycan/LPS O-acetylase OafA/YrhL
MLIKVGHPYYKWYTYFKLLTTHFNFRRIKFKYPYYNIFFIFYGHLLIEFSFMNYRLNFSDIFRFKENYFAHIICYLFYFILHTMIFTRKLIMIARVPWNDKNNIRCLFYFSQWFLIHTEGSRLCIVAETI